MSEDGKIVRETFAGMMGCQGDTECRCMEHSALAALDRMEAEIAEAHGETVGWINKAKAMSAELAAANERAERAEVGYAKSLQEDAEIATELLEQRDAARQDLASAVAALPKPDGYVAWLRFRHRRDNQQPYLSVCNSDDDGAFRVWRADDAKVAAIVARFDARECQD